MTKSDLEFYYVRHGQTEANRLDLTCGGDWDIPINETGISQAKEASYRISKVVKDADVLFVSPMIRAKQTADIINNDLKLPIVEKDSFREWRVGDLEEKPWKEIPDIFSGKISPPNGETLAEFTDRISSGIEEIKKDTRKVLVVSHGGVFKILLKLLGINSNEIIKNCVPYRVFSQNGSWQFQEL